MGRIIEKELGGVWVLGFSLGGEESVVAAPEHNVCFDVGRAPREIIAIDNVCLSHGHMDHAAGVAYYLSQRTFVGITPGRVIVHRGLAQSIQKLMDIWGDIEGHPTPGQIYGVEHLEEVEIRRGLKVRAFGVNHTPTSLGYTLIDYRHKLKTEFHGKTGPELVELKRKGVVIDENVEIPLLTYTGDTAVGRFLDLDFVRNSAGVLMECTFFERDHRERARAGRHIHLDDLPKICEALPHCRIMLTHSTRRTDVRVCKKLLQRALKAEDLERVSMLMDRPPRPGASPAAESGSVKEAVAPIKAPSAGAGSC